MYSSTDSASTPAPYSNHQQPTGPCLPSPNTFPRSRLSCRLELDEPTAPTGATSLHSGPIEDSTNSPPSSYKRWSRKPAPARSCAATAATDAQRPSTWSLRSAASTNSPRKTTPSPRHETHPTTSTNPDDSPAPAAPCPTANSPRSTTPQRQQATTPTSTPSSCAYTWKPPAAPPAPSHYATTTSTPTNARSASEERGTLHWQPVSPTLMTRLTQHSHRNPEPNGQLLRYRNGRPITRRRYDHLWNRIGRELPWVTTRQITTHWLRHTTITWVERNFGYATARAFAAHAEPTGQDGTTLTYVTATDEEVATALATLTGEPHPMATSRAAAPPTQANISCPRTPRQICERESSAIHRPRARPRHSNPRPHPSVRQQAPLIRCSAMSGRIQLGHRLPSIAVGRTA